MQTISVDSLKFEFPDDWNVTKYDDWSFYRNKFSKIWNGVRGVDLIAIDPEQTVWLIEVKDFRSHQRKKAEPIYEEILHKVYDTLAALFPAKLLSDNYTEKDFAREALQSKKLRVVFHCEQPKYPSKLFPQSFDPADVQDKFKKIFKAIDPHALIVSKDLKPASIQWKVL